MLKWAQIPAWDDNYIYLVHDDKEAVVIDPTEADPVIDFLNDNNLKLNRIINTHHHPDHISGIDELVHKYKITVSCSKYDKNRVPHASIFFEPNFETSGRTRWHVAMRASNIYGYSLYVPYIFHICFLNMFHIFSLVCF